MTDTDTSPEAVERLAQDCDETMMLPHGRLIRALAAKLAEARQDARMRSFAGEGYAILEHRLKAAEAQLATARADALREVADRLRILGDMGGHAIVQGMIDQPAAPPPTPSEAMRCPEVKALVEALRPFANYGSLSGADLLPDSHVLTQGSRFAARQITIGDMRRARAAYASLKGSDA